MIVRGFNLKDIKQYEYETGKNILEIFNKLEFSGLIDLISLGNGKCSEEDAYRILERYLRDDGNNLIKAFIEIKDSLLGIGDNIDNDVDENDKVDISKYNSLTDLYIDYSMQLMSVGLGYSEFWSMNTKEIYKVFNSILIKMQNDTNRELSNYHVLAAMVGGAVWGKLQKEPPRVDYADRRREQIENDIDSETLVELAKVKAIAEKFSRKEV